MVTHGDIHIYLRFCQSYPSWKVCNAPICIRYYASFWHVDPNCQSNFIQLVKWKFSNGISWKMLLFFIFDKKITISSTRRICNCSRQGHLKIQVFWLPDKVLPALIIHLSHPVYPSGSHCEFQMMDANHYPMTLI